MTSYIKNSQSSSALLKLPASPISPLETKNQQLETFQLAWLDPHVNTDVENQATYITLQQILTHVRTFNDCNTCEQWLKNYCAKEKIILITSGKFGKTIVPHIHDLKSVVAIYIYCLNRARHEEWARKYTKVCSIVTFKKDLIQQLSSYQKDLESIEDSKAIQVFQDHHRDNDLNLKNASFIWYQLLLEILISPSYLPFRDTFDRLVQILRQYCADNAYHLASIEEFTRTYEPKRPTAWLMYDTPVRRFINKALREQDISILFLLRFFLKDIHFRLATNSTRALRVYKLQLMSFAEIEYLKTNGDQYLFFNGFLCTSTNKPDLDSVNIDNNQFPIVLLEIDANPHDGTSPFAYIGEIDTAHKDQNVSDVLFMCGSIFQIGSLQQTHSSKWTVQLTLAGEKDLKILTDMKRQLRQGRDLCIIGDLLERYDQHDKTIMYYQCLLRELPTHHLLLSRIQDKLQKISKVKSISLIDVQFVLVDLTTRLSKLASAMLNALHRLTNGTMLISDSKPDVDLQKLTGKSVFLFASSQFVASLKTEFKQNLSIFTLESDPSMVDQRKRFGTGEDLICQLADEMYRWYNKEASANFHLGDIKMAKDKENLATRIHSELRKAHEKALTADQDSQPSVCTTTELVWLKSERHVDVNVAQIQRDYSDIVSCCSSFDNKHDCQNHLYNNANASFIFLIIDTNYDESVITTFQHLNNVKRLYRYGRSTLESKAVITSSDNLRYQLTYDLIAHYRDLGAECRAKNDVQQARDMFSKAKKLCDSLAEF